MYTRRTIESRCHKALKDHKILVLLGARQVGKSTLVREMLARVPERDRLILSLDDPFLRDRLVNTEAALSTAIETKAGRPLEKLSCFYLVIDEAQKAPALFERIKALYDSHRDRLRVVLTGSSALEIHDPVAETLAGRARIEFLHPFSLAEGFAHARGEDPSTDPFTPYTTRMLSGRFTTGDFDAIIQRARFETAHRKAWTRSRLLHTLYPEPSVDEQPEQWLRDYLATYLEKDVQSLASVGNVALFRACVRQVAARVGNPLKWETLAQEVGTNSVTLRKYVGLMEQTQVLIRLGTFALNPTKRVIRAPKVYLGDPGLLWALRGFEDLPLLEASGMLGTYVEQLGIAEVAKWCAFEPTGPELRYWHKTKVSEVDLVVSNRGYHIPIEIKLGQQFKPAWLRGLDAFDRDHLPMGLQIPYRFILHFGEPLQVDERTYVLPLWALT